ncbi:aminotransferase class I/II-fold pyridoxal phosphate-dependent enzyme [Candidatus Thorarchaeota archaeon]|nr:MAG: aminotransferase class I/II-fold pyridoxal phosphate-dependent enzyme [Candidatus Thorarchaeota archaeon]
MKLKPFELERMQSENEHHVKYNLSESGVEPLKIKELLDTPELKEKLLNIKLGYSQTNGTVPLREAISHYYPGSTADHIVATNGGAEANFLVSWWLFQEHPDKREFVFMVPNYMQIKGIWRNMGIDVKNFNLRMTEGKWTPDIEQLKSVVNKNTNAIAICNPNNPTGAIISASDLKAIAEIAADNDAWLIADEIYRGAELQAEKAPSIHGIYEKTLITSSLSKAYGLPGLRIGWVVCPTEQVAKELWSYSDYTTISPSTASDWMATLALNPKVQAKIEARTRKVIRNNWAIMKKWLDSHSDVLEYVAPSAAAICFIKQNTGISSYDLVVRLMKEKSVLISPGEHFEVPGYLRIGFGTEPKHLEPALARISELLRELN